MTIGYLEDRIAKLEMEIQNLQEEHEALVEGVRYLHSQIIHDEPQVQQTTDEFVKVVRCKDCKYYDPLDLNRPYDCRYMDSIFGNDYCSRGEKR